MKKDIESYIEHNKQYEDPLVRKWIREECIRDDLNMFEKLGFKKAVDENPKVRNLHIDIGSGAGGLLFKTAPYFKKAIGIEPSKAAIEIAKAFTRGGVKNIEFINAGAVDAIRSLDLDEPVFFTTSIVFSHLKDYHVAECLKLINNAPLGSILLFNEPYDKNIQRRLWYVRRKRWWAENLPNWTLSFREHTDDGYKYKYGIFGICVGRENVINNYKTNVLEDILWIIGGVFHFLLYLPGGKIRLLGGKLIRMISSSLERKIRNF